MSEQGVHTYLLLVDSSSLTVLWANDNVERAVTERGGDTAVGKQVSAIIPFGDALGVPDRMREVAQTGEMRELHSVGFSVTGDKTYTAASIYRLPSGELLVASEYTVAGVPR
ncbi:MAG TPA: hypothetical protein VFG89_08440 [Coriobacteriia bacterium]|nr:hypothetical protein [Coriobacteriia bacterium]